MALPLLAILPAIWPVAAAAQCRLALAVGIDISSSVDAAEDALQRQGLAAALRAPAVRQAVLALPGQPVALAVFEWSGRWQQDMILDWTLLEQAADLELAADAVARSQRSYSVFPTATGFALGYAHTLLANAPPCLFRTVDLSGDGVVNEGFGPVLAYRHYDFDAITVNGLPIAGHDPDVVAHYRQQVLHGPGAFLEVSDGFDDFARAMTAKLQRELGVRMIGAAE